MTKILIKLFTMEKAFQSFIVKSSPRLKNKTEKFSIHAVHLTMVNLMVNRVLGWIRHKKPIKQF